MMPTTVARSGSPGGVGSLGVGTGDAAPEALAVEGFPGVLQAASAFQALASAGTPPVAAEETVSETASDVPGSAVADTDDLVAPPPDLAALLVGLCGTQAAPSSGRAMAAEEGESWGALGLDDARKPLVPVAVRLEGATSSVPASPQEGPPGVAPVQFVERPEPDPGSVAVPVSPVGMVRTDPATPSDDTEPAGPPAPPVPPHVPQLQSTAMRDTPSRVPAGAVAPLAPQAIAPEGAEAEGQPDAYQGAGAPVAAHAAASGGSAAPGTLPPDGRAAGDGHPRHDNPEPMPLRVDPSFGGERPAPAPHAHAATAVAQPDAAGRESGPPESLARLASHPHDAGPDRAAGREMPDAAIRSSQRGGETHEAAVATRLDAPLASRDRVEAAQTPLTQHGVERVVRAVRTSLAHGGMEVRLRLHPDSLGEVRVAVRWEGGLLSAHLEAATPAARDALEGGAQMLRATLQEQGIPLDRLSIAVRADVQSHAQGHRSSSDTDHRAEPGAALRRPERSDEGPAGRTAAPDGRLDIRI